jgi:HEAT repeat protein
LQFATDKDEDVREEAVGVFSQIGVRAIPVLLGGLTDKNPEVRSWTILAINTARKKVTEDAKFPFEAIPLLIKAIDDENSDVATSAMYVVSDIGPRARAAIPVLVKRFKDPDRDIRAYALQMIDRFDAASESAVPAVKEALNDKEELVRAAAKRALAAIESAAAERAKKATMP